MQKHKRSIPKIINAVFASLLIVAALFLCVSVLLGHMCPRVGMFCGAVAFSVVLALLLILWAILTVLLYKCSSYLRLWSYTLSATGVITLIMSASALYQVKNAHGGGIELIAMAIFGYLALIVGIPLLLAGITLFLIEKFK